MVGIELAKNEGMVWLFLSLLMTSHLTELSQRPCAKALMETLSDLDFVEPLDFDRLIERKKGFTREAVAYGFYYQGNSAVIEKIRALESEINKQIDELLSFPKERRPTLWLDDLTRLTAKSQYYDEMLQALEGRFPENPNAPLFPNGLHDYLPPQLQLQGADFGNHGKNTLVSR